MSHNVKGPRGSRAVQGPGRRPGRRGPGFGWGLVPLLAIVLLVGALPYLAALRDSFVHDIYGERSPAGLANYRFLLQDRALLLSATVTLAWAFLEAALATALGWALALILFESRRAAALIYAAILVPWGIPTYIGVPIWRMLIHGAGGDSILFHLTGLHVNLLTDPFSSFCAALFVAAWMGAPGAAFVFYGALRKLPTHAIEAARLDGAGRAALSRLIYRPLVKGSLVAVFAFEFVKAFKEFQVPFLMTAGGPPLLSGITDRTIVGATTTLEIYLYDLFQGQDDWGLAAAYATVAGAVLAILTGLAFLASRVAANRARAREEALLEGGAASAAGGATTATVGVDGAGSAAAEFRNGRLGDLISGLGRGLVGAGAVASGLLVLFALFHMAFSGLSTTYIDSFLPRFFSADNFRAIFAEDGVGRSFLNTLGVSLVTAVLVPLIVFPAAMRLRSAGPGMRAALFAGLQALGSAGGMHSLVPLYALARRLGLTDSYIPVVAVYLFHALPFALFTTTAWLDSLPRSLEEYADLEGASRSRVFFGILVPLSLPAVATCAMTAFITAWNGFLAPLLFLDDDAKYTIGIRLYSYVGSVASGNPQWNRFAAASIVNLLLVGLVLWRLKGPLGKAPLSEHED
jgi:ABC-type sugar transport system permease subunit